MKDKVKIQKIKSAEIEQVLEIADTIYSSYYKANHKESILSTTNWDISMKLTLNNKIIGFYLFKDENLVDFLMEEAIKEKKGIQGVALGVLQEHRGNGYGKMLINKSIERFQKQYDYMWGAHAWALNNIEHWRKRRKIIASCISGGYHLSFVFL